jgi:exosortase
MRIRTILATLGLGASFVFLYHEVIAWLVDDWDPKGDYSHGYLVAALALYFAWQRRAAIRATPRQPGWGGFVALGASMALLLAGTAAAETFLTRISMVLAIVSGVWIIGGRNHLRLLRFPLALLLLMIPIPDIIFNRIAFPLQLMASGFGETALSYAGVPVLREGNLIVLPHMTLEVAEACSGIRSLLALLTLSVVYGYLFEPLLGIRLLLIIATVPIAILVNGLRIAVTGVAANRYGVAAAEGLFHGLTGWTLFVAAALLLVGLRAAANMSLRRFGLRMALESEPA